MIYFLAFEIRIFININDEIVFFLNCFFSILIHALTNKNYQLTEDGRALVLGQIVQKHVEMEHRLKLGLVQTLLPNTVELTVPEMLKKLRTVTQNLVQVRNEIQNE